MATLDRITIFPVKSLDGVEVDTATVLPNGALADDRRWRLVDTDRRVVNGKRVPLVHTIRAAFDLAERLVHLSVDQEAWAASFLTVSPPLALAAATFPLVPGPTGPSGWLTEALGFAVLLEERIDGGFPDDRDAPGATLVSTASLGEVARWYGFDLAECRRRFRANLEVGGCEAFWEDALASPARPELQPTVADLPVDPYADLPPPEPRDFAVGSARFRATNVCRRCPVPSRDSRTGVAAAWFSDIFEARRRQGLRADVDVGAWGTLYRLAVNTTGISGVETGITVGDVVG